MDSIRSAAARGHLARADDNFRAMLGDIKWWSTWRKYCFFPAPATLYEHTCLRDIANFCEMETRKRKFAKKKPKG